MAKKRNLLISTIIGFLLLLFLFKQLQVSQWSNFLLKVNPFWLLPAFLFYLFANFARTVRVWFVFKEKKFPLAKIFSVLQTHNLITSLLPSRTGEVSFVYLMKRVFSVSYTQNIYILLFLRLLDMIVVFSFFVLSLISFKFALKNLFFYSLFILFLFLLIFNLSQFFKLLSFFSNKAVNSFNIKSELILKIVKTLNSVEELSYLKKPALLIPLFICTLTIWISLFTGMVFIIKALGVDLSFYYVIFGSAGVIVASFLPISGIGGFGGAELGWTSALVLSGIEKNTAIPLSFGTHVINLLFAAILGSYGILNLRLKGYLK